jgi:hypothetical protein
MVSEARTIPTQRVEPSREGVFAMLPQGVLPRRLLFRYKQTASATELEENSLNRYGKGHILGILRLPPRWQAPSESLRKTEG